MKILRIPTDEWIKEAVSKLAADVVVGSNVSLTLEDNAGFAQNCFAVIGQPGTEQGELEQVNQAVTPGTGVRVATLLFPHKKGEIVTVYRYNKRKVYGSLTVGGSYTELTGYGSPALIAVDNPQGTIFEYNGGEGYLYFKATYYDSVGTTETALADAVAFRGDDVARYAVIYKIKRKAQLLDNPFITDDRWEDKRMQAENEINSTIMQRYTLPLAEIPPLITMLCELLAAGYVLYEEFGKDGDGAGMLAEARAILKSIQDGRQKLIGADGTELATPENNSNELDGYPDSDGVGDDIAGNERAFERGMRF